MIHFHISGISGRPIPRHGRLHFYHFNDINEKSFSFLVALLPAKGEIGVMLTWR
jgi:hypothetical protein